MANTKVALTRRAFTEVVAGATNANVSLPLAARRLSAGDTAELIIASAAPTAPTPPEAPHELGIYLENALTSDTALLGLPVPGGENLYARWLSGGHSGAGPSFVNLAQSGQAARGIRITVRDDGGDDWTLSASAGTSITATYDADARTLTLVYAATDTLDDVIAVIQDAHPNVSAAFIAGTTGTDTNTPETPSITARGFESEIRYLVRF